ncbi:hypothetical protein BsWGS_13879 [Bradybaena similaris]
MEATMCRALWWIMLSIVSKVICQKSKGSIFDSKPIRVQDYGTPPVTSTIPLYDCSGSHRPKPDVPGAYEVYHDKQWYLQSCQESLVWNQTLCRCEFPNGKRFVVQCRDYRATSTEPTGKYEQLVNGQWIVRDCSLAVAGLVWEQEACQCVWGPDSKEMVTGQGIAPCEIMLNMTFENGIKDEAKGSFVEVGRGNPVPVFAVNKRDSPDGYKAAYFSDTALNIWYFAGNEMGSSLRVEFRFKMTNDPIQRDKYQIFISNGCNISTPGYTTPSLAIGYRAADQSYLLAFETASARKAIVCTRKLGAYDWHTISLIYEDGTLLFRVDEQPCIISQDFTGSVQKTPCPLTIGADPLERESMYKGYLDNLLIARYCRRFIDTDPNESKDKTKGPMPVETAPTVSEFAFQQARPKSDKQTSHAVPGRRQRAVTSTKYSPQLPSILKSGVEAVEHRVAAGGFLENSMGNDEYTHGFLRFPRSGDDSYRSSQAEGSRREHGKSFIRRDAGDDQDNDYDNSEKLDGQLEDFDKSEVSRKQTNDYDAPVRTQEQENLGYTNSKKNVDSRRGYSNSAKTRSKSWVKSPENDEAKNQSSGRRQVGRQANSNRKFRKTEQFNGRFQNSEQTGRKDKGYTYSNGDDISTGSAENNDQDKNHGSAPYDSVSQDYNEHDNFRGSARQRNDEEQSNDWVPLEKRRGSKYEPFNTDTRKNIAVSRESREEEDDSTHRDYRKTREKAQSVDRFTKADEVGSHVRKSSRTSDSYDGKGWRGVQKPAGYEKKGRLLTVNDDELSPGYGNSKNNRPRSDAGYRKKNAPENDDGFDSHNEEREVINGKNIGFKGYSDNQGDDEENVESYSKEKTKDDGAEVSDSNEDYNYSRQTKVKENEGGKKKYEGDNKDQTRDNGKGKKNGGKRNSRGKPEQWQVYKGKLRDTVASNFGTQEKRLSESDAHSDNFEGGKKDATGSEFSVKTEPKLTKIIATSNEERHLSFGVSKHQDATEDELWEDDKKFDDSEEKDKSMFQNVAKSRPARHDRGDISKLDKQQNIVETGSVRETNVATSSRESVSNLVKGRRKSGSKKKNWYDKVDVGTSKQQESRNPEEQNTQLGQSQKPLSVETVTDKDTRRSGKVGIINSDAHVLEYDRPRTSDTSYDRSKFKDDKAHHQNTHPSAVPEKINFGKGYRKPPAHGFIVKDYNQNYEEDFGSERSPRADDDDDGDARMSRDSIDKKVLDVKDDAHVDSNTDHSVPMAKNTEQKPTLAVNDQKHKSLDNTEQKKDGGQWQDQEKKTVSMSAQGEAREPEDVSVSHFNMPVDVTKITSSRSLDVTSNIPQDRTPDMSNPVNQSTTPSEKNKTSKH